MDSKKFCFFLLAMLVAVMHCNATKADKDEEIAYEYEDAVGEELTPPKSSKLTDCEDIDSSNPKKSGIYWLNLKGHLVPAYCEIAADGTKYTVFQRRLDGTVNFFRRWKEYKYGFGNLNREFWWGLLPLSILTSRYRYKLRVELEAFDGTKVYAEYDDFAVGNEDTKFMLKVSGYKGTAGDALSNHDKMSFTTMDNDNDKYGDNCANLYHGGWWYNACHQSNLNGLYFLGKHPTFADGINWLQFKGYNESLKSVKMMITRK